MRDTRLGQPSLTFTFAGLLCMLGMLGCRQLNSSHCANNDGDGTCADRSSGTPYCSRCVADNDGCVADLDDIAPGCHEGESEGTSMATGAGSESGPGTESGSESGLETESSESGTTTVGGTETTSGGVCGNGVIEDDEDCDGPSLNGMTCADFGKPRGELSCDPVACTFDSTLCCLQMGEACTRDDECCSGTCGGDALGCVL